MTFVPMKDKSRHLRECPFKERDLTTDECYSGNGQNRCKYFVRYDWESHYGCIACTHPPLKESMQPSLFGEEL